MKKDLRSLAGLVRASQWVNDISEREKLMGGFQSGFNINEKTPDLLGILDPRGFQSQCIGRDASKQQCPMRRVTTQLDTILNLILVKLRHPVARTPRLQNRA